MNEQMITITMKEYKELLETSIRVGIFIDFVNGQKYCIDKKECANYLGFDIDDIDDKED